MPFYAPIAPSDRLLFVRPNERKIMTAVAPIDSLIPTTLQAPHPDGALRGVVRALLAAGYDRDALLRDLNRRRLHYQAAGQEREEGALVDVLDALAGWCAPGLEL